MPNSKQSGQPRRTNTPPMVSNSHNLEVLLIRIGHHIWKWYKQAVKNNEVKEKEVLEEALYAVWEVKRQYRQPFLERNAKNREATATRMRKRQCFG